MYPDNDWYGHKKIILDYCGFKKKIPIYAQLQHGWYSYYDKNSINLKNFFFDKILYLCWAKNFESFFAKKGINIKSIGSPFLYLCKNKLIINKIKKKTKGTLLFPSHSGPELPQHVNHEKIIEIIKKKYSSPYGVCLFYTDLKKRIINLYKKKNFKVYCCGSRANQNFLNNFYNIVSNFKTCIFTELSTATLYCMYLKKECRIHDTDENKNPLNMYILSRQASAYKNMFLYKYLIKQGRKCKNKLFEIACNELGYESMKTSEELKKILGLRSRFVKFKAFVFSKLYEIKYGNRIRLGLKDNNYKIRTKSLFFDYVVINNQIKKI